MQSRSWNSVRDPEETESDNSETHGGDREDSGWEEKGNDSGENKSLD